MEYYLFVYGTLKKGFSNNYLLENSKFISKAKTLDKFQLYNCKNGYFPFLLKSEQNNQVNGEVYLIDSRTLINLDDLEDFPKLYLRNLFDVELEDKSIIKALIYFKNEENYKHLIDYNSPILEWI